MSLSKDLVAKFVKITNDRTKPQTETTLYGTIKELSGEKYVQLDGSSQLTPVATMSSTTDLVNIKDGNRVMVMIKNHTATVTGNTSSPSVSKETVDEAVKIPGDKITELEIAIAKRVTTEEFIAQVGRIDTLDTNYLNVNQQLTAQSATINDLKTFNVSVTGTLNAHKASIDDLSAKKLDASVAEITYATIEELDALDGEFHTLSSTYATFAQATVARLNAAEAVIEELDSTYATIAKLDAAKARITDLEADIGTIDTLIFGSASGTTIQTSFANAVIAHLGNAQIKSAMIESVSAAKITSGDIITNNVRVKSSDGSLIISDETLQISDGARVRVQIGKDAANDYSINIWDQNGNLMLSKGGITDSAIKDAIIRNDMVSETANISASKLDIDSLFEEINGSANTIKSTRVYLDENKQTLDVVFKSLSSTVTSQGQTISSQGTAISTIQGQISSKIWQQDINTAKNEMSTQYSILEQEVDGISAAVAIHSSSIENKADKTTVTTVSDKVTSLESNLSGFKTTVSETYATKSALSTTDSNVSGLTTRMTAAETNITQLSNKITANVTETTNLGTRMTTVEQTASGLTTTLKDLTIGGRNYIKDSDNMVAGSASNGITVTAESDGAVKVVTTSGNGNWHSWAQSNVANQYLMDGDKFTFSIDIKCEDGASGVPKIYIKSGLGYYSLTGTLSTDYTRFYYTGTWKSDDNVQFHLGWSGTVGTYYVRRPKLEKGNKPTDWSLASEDLDADILAASKTATNYMSFSNSGLVIGDMTKSSLGKNVLIDSDSIDIRSGDTVLASFGASTITLGQNSANSVINLCDGAGTIRALISEASTSYPKYDSIEIASQEINTSSQRFVTDVTNSYGIATTPAIQNDAQIYMLSNKTDAGSFARMEAMCTTTSSGAEMSAGASAIVYDTYSTTRMLIYAHDSTDTLNRSNQVNVYPHKTTFSQPLYRYITGHEYAIFDESMDTGWKEVTSLGSDFVVYSSDINSKVRYRKRGKLVEIRGCVKPTSAIAGSTDNYTIFTLPSGYRPDSQVCVRSQGSGSYSWLLSITTGGLVRFSRYNNGSQYVATSTSSWLPINAIFLIN